VGGANVSGMPCCWGAMPCWCEELTLR
jgi:hypothetical protein